MRGPAQTDRRSLYTKHHPVDPHHQRNGFCGSCTSQWELSRYMEKLPADNPRTDQELNLHIQGRWANHTNGKSTKECFFLGLDPKPSGLSVTLEDLVVGGHKDRRTPTEDFLSWFHVTAQPSAAQRNMGQDRRFHTEDKASTLPGLDISGVLFAKLCIVIAVLIAPLYLHRHLWSLTAFPSNIGTGKQSQCGAQKAPLTWTGRLSLMYFLFHSILRHPLWDN